MAGDLDEQAAKRRERFMAERCRVEAVDVYEPKDVVGRVPFGAILVKKCRRRDR